MQRKQQVQEPEEEELYSEDEDEESFEESVEKLKLVAEEQEEESYPFTRTINRDGKLYVQVVWGEVVISEKEVKSQVSKIPSAPEKKKTSIKQEEKKQ